VVIGADGIAPWLRRTLSARATAESDLRPTSRTVASPSRFVVGVTGPNVGERWTAQFR